LKKVIVPVGALPMLPGVVFKFGVVSTNAVTVNATFAFSVVGGLGMVENVGAWLIVSANGVADEELA
jgi:hypothetical protein